MAGLLESLENLIHVSMQPDGQIFFSNGQYCIAIHSGYDPKLRALSSSQAVCQASSSRFRLVCKCKTIKNIISL